MSRLALALRLPPVAIDQRDNELRKLQVDIDQHAQCRRAFLQSPSPRLGAALRQLEASIKHRTNICKKKGYL